MGSCVLGDPCPSFRPRVFRVVFGWRSWVVAVVEPCFAFESGVPAEIAESCWLTKGWVDELLLV